MESKYLISKNDISTPLFSLEYEHKNEGGAVIDFQIKLELKRDLKAEDTIRDLYAKFRKRYDHVSNPIELLGLLLANGYSLQVERDECAFNLYKDFFPLSFEARSLSKTIKLGDYYRTSIANADDQFITFSRWIDSLSGMSGMNQYMALQFISAGFSIMACEPDKEITLVAVDSQGSILSGETNTLSYLLDTD